MLYTTRDLNGAVDTASGIMVIPEIAPETEYPVLVYQHGTSFSSADLPSSIDTTFALEVVFGGFGYITIASDLLGLGTSKGLHPYVHADSEAWAAVDMLRAVQSFFTDNNIGNLPRNKFFYVLIRPIIVQAIGHQHWQPVRVVPGAGQMVRLRGRP